MDNNKFLLHTVCLTYNHESFIEDALNGFVMQQTSFPFVAVIIDDASTDRTVEVLNRYLKDSFSLDNADAIDKETDFGHITFAQHKNNLNCFFAVICLKENHYRQAKSKYPYYKEWANTKYAAICEGDDYWTDPLKLQKQVDVLETHPEVSMCYTDYDTVDEGGNLIEWSNHNTHRALSFSGDNLRNLFKGNYIMTVTAMFRTDIMKAPLLKLSYDYSLFLNAAIQGKLYYINENTAAYRINHNSLIHTQLSKVSQGLQDIWYAYSEYYINTASFRRAWFQHLMILAEIDAVLITKMRDSGGGGNRAKRFLCSHKSLWGAFIIGALIRLKNRMWKLSRF